MLKPKGWNETEQNIVNFVTKKLLLHCRLKCFYLINNNNKKKIIHGTHGTHTFL